MKMRFLAVLPLLMVGSAHANDWKHNMIKDIFGDKTEITRDEFIKHSGDKFDKIDKEKKGKITQDQFLNFVKEKKEEHMKMKYCGK